MSVEEFSLEKVAERLAGYREAAEAALLAATSSVMPAEAQVTAWRDLGLWEVQCHKELHMSASAQRMRTESALAVRVRQLEDFIGDVMELKDAEPQDVEQAIAVLSARAEDLIG